jgi:hypothetical protein
VFRKINILSLVCFIIALVSITGFINNYGYPVKSLLATASSMVVLFIGCVAIYGMFTKKQWAPLSFVAWMGYGAVNNFVYYFAFKTRPIWVPVLGAVIIFFIATLLMKKIEQDIAQKPPEDRGTRNFPL